MVAEDEIVLDLDNALLTFRVIFLDQQQQFRLYRSLIIVLLLVFHKLHGNELLRFVVHTFKDLTEGSLANLLNDLESEANLVILCDSVVAISIIIAIVYNPLSLCGMYFVFISS